MTKLRRLLMLLSVAMPIPATAQSGFPAEIQPGTRVDVLVRDTSRQVWVVPPQQSIRGTVTALAGDTLRLRVPHTSGTLAISRADVRHLRRSLGVPNRGESAARGLVGGAVLGALYGLILRSTERSDWGERTTGDAALLGAGIGAGIGVVTGAIFPTERWKRVKLR